jgi:hypothetical protein
MDSHGLASDHGFLPSNKLERAIMDASEGIEDEDGNTNGMLKQDPENMRVVRPGRANTGVKGVAEDARQHRTMTTLNTQADAVRRQWQWRQTAGTGVQPARDPNMIAEDGEGSDTDDEEFQLYRLQRLKEMQRQASASASMPTWGMLEHVDMLLYPELVDGVGCSSTFVVVHLQESYLAVCVRVALVLEEIAKKFDQVRFLNVLSVSDVEASIDEADLPIFLVYQDGQLVSSERRVGHESDSALTQTQVEETLLKLGVRLTAAAAMRDADAAALQRMRELGYSESAKERIRAGNSESSEEDEDEDQSDDE